MINRYANEKPAPSPTTRNNRWRRKCPIASNTQSLDKIWTAFALLSSIFYERNTWMAEIQNNLHRNDRKTDKNI